MLVALQLRNRQFLSGLDPARAACCSVTWSGAVQGNLMCCVNAALSYCHPGTVSDPCGTVHFLQVKVSMTPQRKG